jgi:predicted ABC-type ATPase
MIAGPNGAGKTTVTVRLREERWSDGVEYLNPDDIARDRFGDWNSPDAVLNAARWTESRREELLSQRRGIASTQHESLAGSCRVVTPCRSKRS